MTEYSNEFDAPRVKLSTLFWGSCYNTRDGKTYFFSSTPSLLASQ